MATVPHSAEEILAMTEPGDLFTGNPSTLKTEFRELAKSWHPDTNTNPRATDVVRTITDLYHKAEELLAKGEWHGRYLLRFVAKDGKAREIRFLVSRPFELGMMYIGNNAITYIVSSAHKELFDNARRATSGFKYANSDMEREISRYLPRVIATFETTGNELGLVVSKTPDLILLRDLVDYMGGSICERHTAWIMSSLLNIASYLDIFKLTHNAITLDTYFVSPSLHSGALLGGWWYSVPQEQKMLGAPSEIYAIMNPSVKNLLRASISTDLEAIHLLGRTLLGNPSGTSLSVDKSAPRQMVQWLLRAPFDGAVHEYDTWTQALMDSFGAKKFIPLPVTAAQVYHN